MAQREAQLPAASAGVRVGQVWLDQVLEDFERDMLRRRFRPGTVRIYRWAVGDLFDYMKGRALTDVRQLDREVLEGWQDTTVARWTAQSQRSACGAVRQLIGWLADWDLVDLRLVRALAKVHVVDAEPRPIPEEDMAKILALILPRWPHIGVVPLRDRAIFVTLLTTTARVSEVLQMRRDDFESPFVIQKGGRAQQLRPAPIAVEFIRDYMALRIDDSPWLWISFKTNAPQTRLGAAGVWEIMQKLGKKAGVPRFTTHQLRHTGITALREGRVAEPVAMSQAGHRSKSSHRIYAKVPDWQRTEAVDVLDDFVTRHRPARPVLLPKISRHQRY